MTAERSATSATGPTATGRTAVLRSDGAFVVASTVALAGVGALQAAGGLPWVVPGDESVLTGFYDSLPGWAQLAFGAWQAGAVLLGLVLPAAVIARWGRRGAGGVAVRAALAPYALVLLWQVVLEATLARVFFPSIVVLTGVVYTAHRLRQLQRSRRVFAASPAEQAFPARAGNAVRALLVAGTVFWSLNLAFLLTTQLPQIIDR
jgi:hypothetical protein